MDDQQRARELLAQEYERDGITHVPDCIRHEAMLTEMEHRAIRAITAALRAAPEGFGSLSPVDHVRYWAEAYGPQATEPHFQGHGMVAALLTEYADLLERLAGRPQGVKDGMITRVLMLANRWDEVAKTAPSQSGLMNEMARELRAVLHDDRDSVGADDA